MSTTPSQGVAPRARGRTGKGHGGVRSKPAWLRTWMLFLLLPALALGAAGSRRVQAAARADESLAPAVDPPIPPGQAMALVQQPGIYAVWDFSPSMLSPKEQYHLTGSHVTANWSEIQNQAGVYDWTFLDDWLDSVEATGKIAGFGVSTYNGRAAGGSAALPDYLRNNPATVVDVGGGWLVPRYWHTAYLDAYAQFVSALGQRYRNDTRVEWVAIGAGMYGETWACDYADNDAMAAAGLTQELWVSTVQQIIDMYVDAFGEGGQLQKVLLLQSAPFTFHRSERRELGFYAASRDVGFSLNGLYPDQEGAVFSDTESCPYCGMYDMLLLYSGLLPTTFETYDYMLCDPTQVTWGMLNGLDKHPTYLRLNHDLFREYSLEDYPDTWGWGPDKEENLAIFDWVEHYVGVTVENTPSVWTAMREHRVPWQACWQSEPNPGPWYPQWGNYDFWLEQDDSVAGGSTVPETNDAAITEMADNSSPYDPLLPVGPEAWAVRRTDQASGNTQMYFRIDDDYAVGTQATYSVTVTYLDRGSDTWSLHYDAEGGVEQVALPQGSAVAWVQKGNSNAWQQAMFVLGNARFANGLAGGADFRLDCRGDGDEWVHFVDVTKGEPAQVGTGRRDVDHDCDIDTADIMAVAARWGTSCANPDPDGDPNTPNYDPLYEMDDNCVVDLLDVMLVACRWGCLCGDQCYE